MVEGTAGTAGQKGEGSWVGLASGGAEVDSSAVPHSGPRRCLMPKGCTALSGCPPASRPRLAARGGAGCQGRRYLVAHAGS